MASVSLKGIVKHYDKTPVIHGVDLDIADGEFMVFVGPSGCGKSTLLRMIAGLESISGGTLHIGGTLANDIAPAQRKLAMVFQSYALYPHMTVYENMAFALKLAGHKPVEVQAAVERAAAILQIAPLLKRRPKELSGGQRQRVAIGRAIVRKPEVFLFDEPLSNLDASLRVQMRVEISRLHQELKTTMIYVTHDQVEAMTLGQRIVVLKDGVIQQIDTPMALYERPGNLFVAGFLGSPAMNVLRGRLVAGSGLGLQLAGGRILSIEGAVMPADWLGREIVMGVRPEHLQPARSEQAASFETVIEGLEPVGNEIFVNVSLDGAPLVLRVPPQTLPGIGATLPVAIQTSHLHFFDAESGERLSASA
jgi:ABC-type sugar transport system ATPase subunit